MQYLLSLGDIVHHIRPYGLVATDVAESSIFSFVGLGAVIWVGGLIFGLICFCLALSLGLVVRQLFGEFIGYVTTSSIILFTTIGCLLSGVGFSGYLNGMLWEHEVIRFMWVTIVYNSGQAAPYTAMLCLWWSIGCVMGLSVGVLARSRPSLQATGEISFFPAC